MTSASLQRTAILIIAVAVIGLTQQLRAQENAASAIASRMAENSEKLRTYTFKQTAQVYFKGELKKTMVSQVHFDSEGKRVAVPLQVTPAEDTEQRRGRIGRRIVEQKKEEMKNYIERLTGLMGQYLPPTSDRIKAAVPRAQFTQGTGTAEATLPDYLKAGDSMTISLDTAAKRITQLRVKSSLDSDPVSIVVNFSRLPDGTNYPAATTVKSEAKEIELRISTSDYQLQPR